VPVSPMSGFKRDVGYGSPIRLLRVETSSPLAGRSRPCDRCLNDDEVLVLKAAQFIYFAGAAERGVQGEPARVPGA